jgi:hypothetical protein
MQQGLVPKKYNKILLSLPLSLSPSVLSLSLSLLLSAEEIYRLPGTEVAELPSGNDLDNFHDLNVK